MCTDSECDFSKKNISRPEKQIVTFSITVFSCCENTFQIEFTINATGKFLKKNERKFIMSIYQTSHRNKLQELCYKNRYIFEANKLASADFVTPYLLHLEVNKN